MSSTSLHIIRVAAGLVLLWGVLSAPFPDGTPAGLVVLGLIGNLALTAAVAWTTLELKARKVIG